MTIQLGTKESPVRVNCEVTNNYRWIYVRVDYTQRTLMEALESQETERLLSDVYVTTGTNLGHGECKLRYPSNSRSLAGCYVTLVVRPGAFRHRRGQSTLDLYATDAQVVHRPWWTWCL